jgi:hypothetical protein
VKPKKIGDADSSVLRRLISMPDRRRMGARFVLSTKGPYLLEVPAWASISIYC